MTAHHEPVPLGGIIKDVRGKLTQQQLADAVGTDQGTVSRWETGALRPDLSDLIKIEEAAKVPRGTILRRAGYIAEVATVRDLLEADGSLPRAAIPRILDVIEGARKSAG